MRAILLGLMLLCACSSGSDLLAPSAPSGPNVFPHGIDPGSNGQLMAKRTHSQTTGTALGRAPQ